MTAFFGAFMNNFSQPKNKTLSIVKANHEGQFLYQDRWVNKDNFRAFVYDKNGNQKLANSYKEFELLTQNGIWFSVKPVRKSKDDSVR
jgi:hypothetical protein